MRYMRAITASLAVAVSSAALAADHPDLSELTPLLTRSIESDEVQAIVKKYDLRKEYKFDSGSFVSEDHAIRLMFRGNRISYIILHASPWLKGYGDANWTTYSHPLPGNLKPTDNRKEVEAKLRKPTAADPNRWVAKEDKTLLLWIHFAEKDTAIDEVWVSAAPAKP